MKILRVLPVVLSLVGCATLADGHPGLDNPPSAKSGPFRLLASGEIGDSHPAPYVISDSDFFYRDPSILDLDGDPSTLAVTGYFAAGPTGGDASSPPVKITSFASLDGRTFDRAGTDVLSASDAWEGGTIGAPSTLRHGGKTWLYYAAAGGIGLARSSDGAVFDKESGPILEASSVSWASGSVPQNPSVVELPEGSLHLFFQVEVAGKPAIGEAESSDGVTWTMVGDGPVIASGSLGEVDRHGAAAPFALTRTTAEGRDVLDLYFAALTATGPEIALASRYLDGDHSFQAAPAPALGNAGHLGPRKPCVVRFADFTLIFSTANASKSSTDPAVLVGVAPATTVLPAPNPR